MSTDKNNLVYQEQLDDNVIEMLSEDIGSNYSLSTENTKTIVAALTEILGKDIICNAVGSPLLTTDTFAELGEKINVMVSDFKAKLLGLGVSVSSIDKLASLIEKMGEIDLGVDAEELMAPLEESLREILGDEGVELSGEETLAELIIKVDEEFNKDNNQLADKDNTINDLNSQITNLNNELAGKVTPAGNAVAADVISGKTFINSTGELLTGTATISSLGGMQFASGTVTDSEWDSSYQTSKTYTISGLTFTPKHFILCFEYLALYDYNDVNDTFYMIHTFDNQKIYAGDAYVQVTSFSKTSFTLYGAYKYDYYESWGTIKCWYAFG